MVKDLDRCSPCAQAAGLSLYNKLLRKIALEEAKELFKKITNDKISMKKYFAEAKKLAREYGTAKDLKAMAAIDRMIREEG